MQTFVQRLVPIPLSFFLLSSLLPVSPGCDEQTSYLWNVQNEKKCCRKCQPGYFMKSRCQQGADTQCVQCQDGHYNKHYNIKFNCETCTNCNQEHFMYQSLCTRIKNSVCTCKPGYECQDNSCSRCIEQKTASVNSATAKTATVASSSNNTTTTGLTSLRSSDTWWKSISMSAVILCIVLISLILVLRYRTGLQWAKRTANGLLLTKTAHQPQMCTEGQTPVQESDKAKAMLCTEIPHMDCRSNCTLDIPLVPGLYQ
ncbi:tumor necrosis factor receptor superfamily member 14-like [Lepisosteus oculatus]|uniref:tumor necrosis factor receptor superfamily member 14-like n=1 Tax=Lepisosteus oculatus TaxID=7918 RepID=UPI00073FE51D|nr:PREDICTED: tumor necrosis factor receptor superfamily member 14-like isoform X1 [Lepisosteus oculatus]